MQVASLKLCKDLYKLGGWKDTFNYWEYADGIPVGEPYLTQPELMRRYGLWSTQEVKKTYPAYDLGYLLRRIADGTRKEVRIAYGFNGAYAELYGVFEQQSSDIAENATCKLAIELFRQGILTKSAQ